MHKYKCNDAVLLNPSRLLSRKTDPTLVYEIVRLMPPDSSGEFGYRIRADGAERAVAECEIQLPPL